MNHAVYFVDKNDTGLTPRYLNAPVPRIGENVVLGDASVKYKVRGVEYQLQQYTSDVSVDVFVQLEEV